MAKKDPSTPEWLARCVDVVAAFSDGSREKDRRSGFSFFITLPPFSDLGDFSLRWRDMAEKAVGALTAGNVVSEVKISGDSNPRTQYLLSGEGGFREAEDKILGLYEKMFGEIMGSSVSVWKTRLEQTRPTSLMGSPGEMAAKLEAALPSAVSIPDLKDAFAKAKTDPYDLGLLPALVSYKGAIEAKSPQSAQVLTECMDEQVYYRNAMRVKFELWMERALLPLVSPYLGPLFKSQSGETPSFRDPGDYYGKLLQYVFSEEFSKTPRMTLESAGVFNSKTFPVSPFRLRAGAPYAIANGSEVNVKFGWLQSRLHWKLETAVLNALTEHFGNAATLIDSRKNTKAKYPDPFGIETINTQQLNIRAKDPSEAKTIADGIETMLRTLYEKDFIAKDTGSPYYKMAADLVKETDLITMKTQSDREKQIEKKQNMKIEDRIVPYANKSSVYIQVAGDKLPAPLYEAIKETLAEHPGWNAVVPNGNATSYISLHLSAPHTSEAAGLAERHSVAYEVSRRYQEKTGEDRFPVRYPDTGYKVEVTKRRINPQDKTDETSGIYVKMPIAFVPGGVLEEKAMEDESAVEKLDPVSKGFYELDLEFGRAAQKKSIFKLFTQASSPLEVYTKTWLYKLKPDDDAEDKLDQIRTLLETRISELFPADAQVGIDWMPDKAAKKLDSVNGEIESFINKWTGMYAASDTAREQEITADIEI